MEKTCAKCGETKDIDVFARTRGRSSGYQRECRACAAEYYRVNRERILPQIRAGKKRHRAEMDAWLDAYLVGHPCVDCGESDLVVLDFDHVRGVKSFNVSMAARYGWSLCKIQEEVAKCEVRCANCHRRRTAVQHGWRVKRV